MAWFKSLFTGNPPTVRCHRPCIFWWYLSSRTFLQIQKRIYTNTEIYLIKKSGNWWWFYWKKNRFIDSGVIQPRQLSRRVGVCFFIFFFPKLPTFGRVCCNSTALFSRSDILSIVKQPYRFPQVWHSSVLTITLFLLSGPALVKCPAALAFHSHLTALDWKEKGKSLIFQELSWAYNKIISSPSKWMEPTVHC